MILTTSFIAMNLAALVALAGWFTLRKPMTVAQVVLDLALFLFALSAWVLALYSVFGE